MNWLLSAIVFLPLVGGIVVHAPARALDALDRRHLYARRLRALALALLRPADHRRQLRHGGQPGVEGELRLDQHHGRHLPLPASLRAGDRRPEHADDHPQRPALLPRRRQLVAHREAHQVLHGDDPRPGVRRDGRLRRLRPLPLLPLLGGRADPDVPADRHLGRRAARVRGVEVPDLHLHRLSLHAGGHLPALLPDWRRQRRVRVSLVAGRAEQGRRHAAVLRRWRSRCRW